MTLPIVARTGGLYRLTWEQERVTLDIERIKEHSDSVSCMVTVIVDLPGYERYIRAPFHLNLTSLSSRTRAAKEFAEICDAAPWLQIFEQTAGKVLASWREGQPRVNMAEGEARPPEWLLRPLLLKGLPTMLYGDGGTQKSYVSLLCAISLVLPWGHNPLGWATPGEATPTLILDWETSHDTVQWRIQRIARGMDLPTTIPIEYRRCTQRFADDLAAIEKHILDCGAKFVIVDSLGPACSGDLKDAETVTSFFNSLRDLDVTSLLITHIAKDDGIAPRKNKTPYGSVYFWNLARSAWEIRKTQEPGAETMTLGLYHRKMNEGPLSRPFGLSVTFDEQDSSTIFAKADLGEDPDLAKGLTLKERIIISLKRGPLATKDIAEDIEDSPDTVRRILNRFPGKFTRVGEKWGLVSNESGTVP